MAYTKIIPIKTNLNRAINYITNADKTDENILVGALNCRAEKAYNQMQDIKSHYDKRDGRLGYHLMYMSTEKWSTILIEKWSKVSLVIRVNPVDSFFKAMAFIS